MRLANRIGFTLGELLLVIVLIAVLVGMLMPAIGSMKSPHQRNGCSNNQRQIVISMLAYANDNDSYWPVRPTRDGRFSTDPDARETALASFEFLSAQSGKELPAKLFSCPTNPSFMPRPTKLDAKEATYASMVSTWAKASGPSVSGYCYDWSAPAAASAERVVTADRAAESFAHKNSVVVCYADGHTAILRQSREKMRGPHQTANIDGSPFTYGWIAEAGDQIYDDEGDGDGMLGEGTGSATRSWVK